MLPSDVAKSTEAVPLAAAQRHDEAQHRAVAFLHPRICHRDAHAAGDRVRQRVRQRPTVAGGDRPARAAVARLRQPDRHRTVPVRLDVTSNASSRSVRSLPRVRPLAERQFEGERRFRSRVLGWDIAEAGGQRLRPRRPPERSPRCRSPSSASQGCSSSRSRPRCRCSRRPLGGVARVVEPVGGGDVRHRCRRRLVHPRRPADARSHVATGCGSAPRPGRRAGQALRVARVVGEADPDVDATPSSGSPGVAGRWPADVAAPADPTGRRSLRRRARRRRRCGTLPPAASPPRAPFHDGRRLRRRRVRGCRLLPRTYPRRRRAVAQGAAGHRRRCPRPRRVVGPVARQGAVTASGESGSTVISYVKVSSPSSSMSSAIGAETVFVVAPGAKVSVSHGSE